MSVVIVTGGRDYARRDVVWTALDSLHFGAPTDIAHNGIDLLIEGECPYGGADRHAREWAIDREVPFLGMPARFKSVGKHDGPERNERMARFARALCESKIVFHSKVQLVHFPGGNGTASCIARTWRVMSASTLPWGQIDGAALAAKLGVT